MIESQHKARMMTSFLSQNCRFQQKTTSGVLHLFHLLPKILDCRGLLFLKNILYIDEIAANSYRYGETALALNVPKLPSISLVILYSAIINA